MADVSAELPFLLTRTPTSRPPFTGPQEALVVSVDTAGVRFTMPSFHPDLAFGPARWGKPTGAANPAVGTRCLVVFVGDDLSRPWIVAWSGYPS